MTNALLPHSEIHPLLHVRRSVHSRIRVNVYLRFVAAQGYDWTHAPLAQWRDALLHQGLAPTTVQSYLSSVRECYRDLLESNSMRDALYALCPEDLAPSDRKSAVDEALVRIHNAVSSRNTAVEVPEEQDAADSQHVRLTPEQVTQLLDMPRQRYGEDALPALRDEALLTLLLCTGIREAELIALDVPDLYERYGGAPALRVRRGKGLKQRLVPYGAMDWCLAVVEAWLEAAGIQKGAILRSFGRYYRFVNETRLTTRSVQKIVKSYHPDGLTITPHDLRRTYAKNAFNGGMSIEALRQNLGHSDTKTTLLYIGALDATQRMPTDIYRK